MPFDEAELAALERFEGPTQVSAAWSTSEALPVKRAASGSEGRFARLVVEELVAPIGKEMRRFRGRNGNRFWIGQLACEVKLSTEDTRPRFQQVRSTEGEYQALIAIALRPADIVYWALLAADVDRLVEQGAIAAQHYEGSRWFFPSVDGQDAFSPFRMDAAGLTDWLRQHA